MEELIERLVAKAAANIQNFGRELFRLGRDKIGANVMGEIIAGPPGLGPFA